MGFKIVRITITRITYYQSFCFEKYCVNYLHLQLPDSVVIDSAAIASCGTTLAMTLYLQTASEGVLQLSEGVLQLSETPPAAASTDCLLVVLWAHQLHHSSVVLVCYQPSSRHVAISKYMCRPANQRKPFIKFLQ